jgi:predicted nucleic acid-binding protein
LPKRPIACDTTVLLYLGRIGLVDLLPALFAPICIPESVMLELDSVKVSERSLLNPPFVL